MYKPSAALVAAMSTKPYLARIKLDDGTIIESNPQHQDDPVKEIIFRGGTTASEDGFLLGGTTSSTVVLSLNRDAVNCSFKDRQLRVELGIDLGSAVEWIPMGVYYATQPLGDDDQLTVEAYDALYAKFEREYEPLDGFAFGSENGVDSVAFLQALCTRRGVAVNVSNLQSIPLVAAPDGFTERQIIGFIAALYGGFAVIDRNGVLRIRRYAACDTHVTPDEYYDGGMEKAEYTFQAKWIKCYNSTSDLTMILGDTAAQQGIYMESIWMTHTILNDLWEQLKDFSYTPISELSFYGNPLLDPGDIVTLTDLAGQTMTVPIMKISHEYDGGVITQITANGQQEAEGPSGSLQNQLRRTEAKAKQYTDDQTGKLDQLELLKRLTKEWVDEALYLTNDGRLAIKASAILTGVLDATLVTIKNLIAEKLSSIYRDDQLAIDSSSLKLFHKKLTTFSLLNIDGQTQMQMTDFDDTGRYFGFCELGAMRLILGGMGIENHPFAIEVGKEDGKPRMKINNGAFKELDWQPNGDGTYTLIGR